MSARHALAHDALKGAQLRPSHTIVVVPDDEQADTHADTCPNYDSGAHAGIEQPVVLIDGDGRLAAYRCHTCGACWLAWWTV